MDDQDLLDATLLAAMGLLAQGKVQAAKRLQRLLKDLSSLKDLVGGSNPPREARKSILNFPANHLPGRGHHAR